MELRKARKDDQLTKRRNIETDELDNSGNSPGLLDDCATGAGAILTEVNETMVREIMKSMMR